MLITWWYDEYGIFVVGIGGGLLLGFPLPLTQAISLRNDGFPPAWLPLALLSAYSEPSCSQPEPALDPGGRQI